MPLAVDLLAVDAFLALLVDSAFHDERDVVAVVCREFFLPISGLAFFYRVAFLLCLRLVNFSPVFERFRRLG